MSKKNKTIVVREVASPPLKSNNSIYIKLPMPEKEVMEKLTDSGTIIQYFSTVKAIADREAQATEKCASLKFNYRWKLVAILCAFAVFVLALVASKKITIKYIGDEYTSEKRQK